MLGSKPLLIEQNHRDKNHLSTVHSSGSMSFEARIVELDHG